MLTIACVLRSGGDYSPDYVTNLYHGVSMNCSFPFRFVCLTDMKPACETLPINPGLRGWWAKMEVFKLEPPVLYFDLDTVITGNLDSFYSLDSDFYMLHAFAGNKGASGVMFMNTDMSWLYDEFMEELSEGEYIYKHDALRLRLPSGMYRGDQDYIFKKTYDVMTVHYLQSYISGIYSFKHHCDPILRSDARVVCFHGKPRPHQTSVKWMEDYWTCHS